MEFQNNKDQFDQHFLIDQEVIDKFIEVSNLTKEDTVLEIGPGKGNISSLIAPKVKKLICVELDTRLKPYLNELTKTYKNTKVIYDSILDIEIPSCTKIVTSLPYSIIEPLMVKISSLNCKEIIMIIGNRFADNVIEGKITRLSVFTNCFFHCQKVMEISPNSFMPPPRVKSAIIKLQPKAVMEIDDECQLILRYMFLRKYKKVKNCIIEALIDVFSTEEERFTKRMAKNILFEMNLNDEISNTKFEVCSNEDLEIIIEKIKQIHS